MKKRSLLEWIILVYEWVVAIAFVLVGVLVLVIGAMGCTNVAYHLDADDPDPAGVYRGTRDCSRAVAQAFVERPEWHSGSVAEAKISRAMCILFLPFIVVDWPLEVVADTITLPYDLYKEVSE